jgi:hypothetical protein
MYPYHIKVTNIYLQLRTKGHTSRFVHMPIHHADKGFIMVLKDHLLHISAIDKSVQLHVLTALPPRKKKGCGARCI